MILPSIFPATGPTGSPVDFSPPIIALNVSTLRDPASSLVDIITVLNRDGYLTQIHRRLATAVPKEVSFIKGAEERR